MKTASDRLRLVLLATLGMGYGWGWRGDYGHELGAMLPGALVAMAVCLAAGRRDWQERCLVGGLLGAVGWGFGGSQSYGIVLGYTLHSNYWGIAYGYACLFVIGALWGAIGGGFLGLGLTWSRSRLNSFIGPIVAVFVVWAALDLSGITARCEEWTVLKPFDVDWVAAVSAAAVCGLYLALVPRSAAARLFLLMALGWCAGFAVLTLGLGWRMTPPRSDNWAGIVGVFIALCAYLLYRRERAATMVLAYGGLFGGLGFSAGSIFLGYGSTYHWQVNGWKLMEQSFGLVMGLGIGLAALRLAAQKLPPPEEDAPAAPLNNFALWILFPGVMGLNFRNNIYGWLGYAQQEAKIGAAHTLSETVFGYSVWTWFGALAALGAASLWWGLRRHKRSPFLWLPTHPLGQGQLLYLTLLWLSVAVDFLLKIPRMANASAFFCAFSFAVLAWACTVLLLDIRPGPDTRIPQDATERQVGRLGWGYYALCLAVPLIILALAQTAVAIHPEGLPNSQSRFAPTPPAGP